MTSQSRLKQTTTFSQSPFIEYIEAHNNRCGDNVFSFKMTLLHLFVYYCRIFCRGRWLAFDQSQQLYFRFWFFFLVFSFSLIRPKCHTHRMELKWLHNNSKYTISLISIENSIFSTAKSLSLSHTSKYTLEILMLRAKDRMKRKLCVFCLWFKNTVKEFMCEKTTE